MRVDKEAVVEGKELNLTSIEAGGQAIVLAIHTTGPSAERLCSMGIYPGAAVGVLQNSGGPVVVAADCGRIAVERRITDTIMVI
jgi:Fe2+ transport system protein FeoA